jgi:hypothetical protein
MKGTKNNKMISVEIKFWTNDLNPEGGIMPKHAWDSGMVYLLMNDRHGIPSTAGKPFNSLMQINPAIEELLIENGIKLHSTRSGAYYSK